LDVDIPNWVNSDRPFWDDRRARALIGKSILAGVTYANKPGIQSEPHMVQIHGTIVGADEDVGITIECAGSRKGTQFILPPHLESFTDAAPGEYRLRTTGEVVNNPQVITTWVIQPSPND
jgi:hypothetical protein